MEKRTRARVVWITWSILTMTAAAYLTAGLLSERAAREPWLTPARSFLLPGDTSDGHYQIELACEACHADPFGGREVLQEACVRCHGAELKAAEDKHPLVKFTDPRNADLLTKIDATRCVTCHAEHRPEITAAMGVTVPLDYCFHCHEKIAEERPSHAGMGFDTCAAAGCHNFHDNRALYEDFLLRHLDDAETRAGALLPARDYRDFVAMLSDPSSRDPAKALGAESADGPPATLGKRDLVADWLASSHARAGVNCTACHELANESGPPTWVDRPDARGCTGCHGPESEGFLAGRHGMRSAQALGPMTPAEARLPMRAAARGRELGCVSCHPAHEFDTRVAAVRACLGCHVDEHSLAYEGSPHHRSWEKEIVGAAPPGSGVSCATCHLPRVEHRDPVFDIKRVLVQHNQNDSLRPNEKMLRPVCLHCHGLAFSIDALADEELIEANFQGRPRVHVRGLEMVTARVREQAARREATPTEPRS